MNLSRILRPKILLHLALVGITFLATAEICGRIDDAIKYGAPLLGDYTRYRLWGRDAEGLRYNKPGSRFEKWRINQYGFRGPDYPLNDGSGTLRIVALGASETFGLYENEGKEWPAQLQDILHPITNVRVINGSIVGMGLNHFKRYIEKYVLPYHPDIMIFDANFFPYTKAPEEERREEAEEVEARPVQTARQHIMSPMALAGQLRIKSKLKEALKAHLPADIVEYIRLRNMSREVRDEEKRFLKGQPPSDSVTDEQLMRFQKDYEDLIDFVQSRGIKVVLCSYPILMNHENLSDYSGIFFDNRRFCVHLSFDGMIDAAAKFNERIREIARSRGLPLVDLASILPQDTAHFGDNVHFTDEGAQVVARSVAAKLEESYLANKVSRK